MDYHIKGGMNTITGDVDWLVVHAGVVYLKGQVKTLVHTGGVIYDQSPSNRVEYRTDHISEEDRSRYRRRIAELENRLSKSDAECLNLRKKLNSSCDRLPEDDVLVAKIERLQIELANERKGRKQEVDDLKYRLNTALRELNTHHQDYNDAIRYEQQLGINDEMLDVLATLVNLYPFTTDRDLAFEFGIKVDQVRYIAKTLKLAKSKEKRQEAVEYLRRQHIEFIQRRGGDQGNHKPRTRQVEKVDKKGKVLASYKSIVDAANRTGCSSKTIQKYCLSEKTIYMKDGITFRYKKDDNTTKQSGGH